MAGRHVRPPDPNAPPAPAPGVDRRLILAGALVVLAALVIFLVLQFHLLGGDTPSGSATPTSARPSTTKTSTTGSPSTTPSKTPTVTPTPPVTPSPSVTPTVKPSGKPTIKPSVKPSGKPTPTPTPTKTTTPPPPPPPPAPKYPLLVLNNSSISGLGSAAAADFEAGGWTISGVGNLTGRIKDTTVYYDPGYQASALALARQFPQLHRVLARIPGLPGSAKVTVVVTRYYEPGGGK